jgi:hypothetical protein
MLSKGTLVWLSIGLILASFAGADTRIVQQSRHEAFTVMGREQPAFDAERVIWIGTDRLRMDEAGASFIVRADSKLLYIVDHDHRTVSSVELPVDLASLLPEGVAGQMLAMMQPKVVITPSDDTKMVGPWKARRYDVVLTSDMAQVTNTMWATTEVEVDRDAYFELFREIVSLQPGMADVLAELRNIDGFVVQEESVATMPMAGDAEMRTVDTTVSVEEVEPPEGTYDPPADYDVKAFDLLAAMQGN